MLWISRLNKLSIFTSPVLRGAVIYGVHHSFIYRLRIFSCPTHHKHVRHSWVFDDKERTSLLISFKLSNRVKKKIHKLKQPFILKLSDEIKKRNDRCKYNVPGWSYYHINMDLSSANINNPVPRVRLISLVRALGRKKEKWN